MARARPLAERKNIRIVAEALDGILEGDRELMEYAVYNLLTNAVKYSPPGYPSHGRAAGIGSGTQLRLSVQDQGIGMDAKELRQIFQKFYRTKRAEASGEAGTGIGLSIVEQIVQHHGGKMEVTSQPGQGSCFTDGVRRPAPLRPSLRLCQSSRLRKSRFPFANSRRGRLPYTGHQQHRCTRVGRTSVCWAFSATC